MSTAASASAATDVGFHPRAQHVRRNRQVGNRMGVAARNSGSVTARSSIASSTWSASVKASLMSSSRGKCRDECYPLRSNRDRCAALRRSRPALKPSSAMHCPIRMAPSHGLVCRLSLRADQNAPFSPIATGITGSVVWANGRIGDFGEKKVGPDQVPTVIDKGFRAVPPAPLFVGDRDEDKIAGWLEIAGDVWTGCHRQSRL